MMSNVEYRAVFGGPTTGGGSVGPARQSIEEALEDKPERAEETHQYLIGIDVRQVEPWSSVSLASLFELDEHLRDRVMP